MPRKNEKDEIIGNMPTVCSDEATAVEFFERMRWADGAACPRCGDVNVRKMLDRDGNRNARFLWRCYGCKRQFTVRVGTIMEDSPIPVRFWAFVVWQACASKKGVSAKQIERQIQVSYKTALYMLHRVRWAMVETGGAPLLGTIEVDETYVGGRPRKGDRPRLKPGRGTLKTPVVAMVERSEGNNTGRVRTRVVANVTAATLGRAMRDHVDPASHIKTDEWAAYPRASRSFASHEAVQHGAGEYARGEAHTNNAESFFSRLKRSVFGVHHKVSREHLHRYVTNMEYLHNTRALTDGARISTLVRMMEGKRLMLGSLRTA